MPSFSFVHAADLHLDSPFSILNIDHPELAAALRSATFDAFEQVLRLCLERSVDFLLVAGDVYDGADRGLRAQVRFRDGLARLGSAGVRTFVVHGNHDPLKGWSATLEWPPGVHVFRERLETVPIERDGRPLACVQGVSYAEREERRNLALQFQRTSSLFHIGLLHANLGSDTGHEPYAPCAAQDLVRSGMDYWALGHVHGRRVVSADRPVILYPGNTQGRNIREAGEKGCTLVEVREDGGVELAFHATDAVRWREEAVSLETLQTEQELIDALDRTCARLSSEGSGRPTIVRVTLTGRSPLYASLMKGHRASDLLEILRERGAACDPGVWVEQVRLEMRPVLDLDRLREQGDFVGELLRYAREVSKDAGLQALGHEELASLFQDPRAARFIESPRRERLADLLGRAEEICADTLLGEEGG